MHYPSSPKRNQTTIRKLVIVDVVLMQCKRNSRPLICQQELKPLRVDWCKKIKTKTNDNIKRYKSLVVIKDCIYVEGLDFFEKFSLVAKMTIFILMLALASIYN